MGENRVGIEQAGGICRGESADFIKQSAESKK
jgi:hypothetical protein